MDIKQRAAKLIRKYHTDDPFKLAPLLNINIVYGPLGGKYGNYMKYRRSRFIFIDTEKTPENMLPFICAHELGHALYTPDVNTSWMKAYTIRMDDKVERKANLFAIELLLSDMYIKSNNDVSLYRLAVDRGIPDALVGLKKFNHIKEH